MYIVGITGASGSIIGIRLIEELLAHGVRVLALASDGGMRTLRYEMFRDKENPIDIADVLRLRGAVKHHEGLKCASNSDFFSAAASGSSDWKGAVIAPCSMKTLAAVSGGSADSLIARAADVALKESRPLVLVPRETPLSLIHLENMVRAKRAGASIVIPAPAFYTFPETADDIVNFIVGRILSVLGIANSLVRPWGAEDKSID